MTINNSWGYRPADDDWKTARTCVEHLVCAAAGGGNYLLNIGPRADGSIPEPSARVLRSMGRWLAANEEAIRDSDRGRMDMLFNIWGRWTAKGNTAYLHVFAWPGRELVVGGRMSKVRSARFLATGKGIRYRQERDRLFLLNLPEKAPDSPATVIAIECAGAPRLRLGAGCKLLPAK
jgi:alpha-L-fucosidase